MKTPTPKKPATPSVRKPQKVRAGIGYRLLSLGEVIMEGDDAYCWPPPQNGWHPATLVGEPWQTGWLPVRRLLKRKCASPRVRKLRSKLEALAAVGIEGEKVSAQKKLDRLLKRFDFMAPEVKLGDMFAGRFVPSPISRHLAAFAQCDQDIAAAVKWAIEAATGLHASFRGDELLVEVDVSCLPQLTNIANRITNGCQLLWERFERAPGITPRDRGLFLRGIYDGMMDDKRRDGELLPARRIEAVKASRKRNALATAPGIGVHPYTVALDLGRQLRFETPVTDIVGSLEEKIGERKQLA